MADVQFNISRGKVNEYFARVDGNDPANSAIVIVLLKVAEADATLVDYDDLAAVLAGSNTEADFTNYARKVLTDTDITAPVPDDTNDWQVADIAAQTWTSAGGTLDNTLVKLLLCYDSDTTGGTDANIVPIAAYDFAATTNGADLTATPSANGLYRAKAAV